MDTLTEPNVLAVEQMTAPCLRIDVEMSDGVPCIPAQSTRHGARCAWLLVRVHSEAIGSLVLEVPPEGLTEAQVAVGISRELGEQLERRLGRNGIEESPGARFLTSRRDVLRHAPKMTAVVCTHERPEGLEACLKSLLAQEYPDFSVLVIDNAPTTGRSRSVVDGLGSPVVTYALEPRRGLSWARTKALELVDDEIVAWIDDDETADRHWLSELARGFHDQPEADAVSGIMVPAELETWPQVWFEQFGGHNKHRGFTPAVFSPKTAEVQSPLYPLPQFGSGGNMAFRLSALERIGGFDVALGAGSPCMGSEDTRAFTDLLYGGGSIVYQPTAVTYHFHRRSLEELRRQMLGYGVGLTAFYTSMVVSRPWCIPDLVRLVPKAFRDLFSTEGLQRGGLPSDFPPELLKTKQRGMLIGPARYGRARIDAGRMRRK
jgi:glycosyltransferase involved in cell wall biosynthesis